MTMTTQTIQTENNGSRRPLTILIYAVLFIILTSACFLFLSANYDRHLVLTKQFDRLRTTTEYSGLLQALFCGFQLLIIVFFFHPLRRRADAFRPLSGSKHSVLVRVSLGLLSGFLALLVLFPAFLAGRQEPTLVVSFLLDHFGKSSDVLMLLILVLVLPLLSEVFFRGILLKQLMESVSTILAVILSVILFMFWWPVGGFVSAGVFGLAAGLLFYWTRSILACVAANFLFTIGLMALQIWRS